MSSPFSYCGPWSDSKELTVGCQFLWGKNRMDPSRTFIKKLVGGGYLDVMWDTQDFDVVRD